MSIRRNTALNLAGNIAPAVVSVLVLPHYLHFIGEERYGVLAMVWILMGYFNMFDFGLGRAVAQRVAELRDEKPESRNRLIWTALTLAGGLSVIGGGALYVTGSFGLERCFGVDAGPLHEEFFAALPWIALTMPANFLGSVLSGALQGREEFVRYNLITTVSTVWAQLVPMTVACFWSHRLEWLVPAAVSSRLLTLIWMFFDCRRTMPMSMKPAFDRSLVGSLFKFGGWVTVSAAALPLMNTADRFVMGALRGAAAVTGYSIPYQLVNRATVLPVSVSVAIFPRFAVGEPSARFALLLQSTGTMAAIFTPICLSIMFLLGPALNIWGIGHKLAAEGTILGQVLIIGVWANGLDLLPHTFLQANAKPRVSALFHLCEVAPYFAGLWLALRFWGLFGAAVAWSLRTIIDTVLQYRACGYKAADWREPGIAGLVLLAGLAVVVALPVSNPWRWVVSAVILFSSIILGWRRLPEDWRQRFAPYLPWGVRA